ncbi:MAG TPA: tRNA threonylcarbamoyladenosine dehydratase [Candidatus Gastranaerophilales bacterium]|nr:tRNA threonylcarbamoyladenosine dehydratase [Candidatus Gastranaerophilales bacterium]
MDSILTNIYDRNERLWGKTAQAELFKKHVVVFGLGGVGGYATEALARSGVGNITIVDFDTVSETNINRQLIALIPNIGKPKTALFKERISQINPHIKVTEINEFVSARIIEKILDQKTDFVADAIDTLKSKIELIEICRKKDISVITSLGMGNRIKPEELYLADISEIDTKKCVFAKNVVYQLKKRGIEKDIPAVASKEKPIKTEKRASVLTIRQADGELAEITKFSPGSASFVPPVAGYFMAAYIIRQLIKNFITLKE